ncbi:MAG TPA: DUF72 domain-containing protein [Thermoleophilaceae bacterium]
MKPVHIGCSGWNYADWRDRLYPKGLPTGRWLERYAEVFETVEINSSFYRLVRPSAAENWVRQTPADFIFAAKASRYLTHIRRLRELDQGIKRFYEGIQPLVDSGKLGPVVWQFPANFHRDDERLESALGKLPPGKHCFEFRHESWFVSEVYELLRRHGAALIIGDHPERPFQSYEFTTDWTFVRFHYGRRGRNGNYSKTELEEWADRLRKWRRRVEVFAYFNNDWRGYAVENGKALERLLGLR